MKYSLCVPILCICLIFQKNLYAIFDSSCTSAANASMKAQVVATGGSIALGNFTTTAISSCNAKSTLNIGIGALGQSYDWNAAGFRIIEIIADKKIKKESTVIKKDEPLIITVTLTEGLLKDSKIQYLYVPFNLETTKYGFSLPVNPVKKDELFLTQELEQIRKNTASTKSANKYVHKFYTRKGTRGPWTERFELLTPSPAEKLPINFYIGSTGELGIPFLTYLNDGSVTDSGPDKPFMFTITAPAA